MTPSQFGKSSRPSLARLTSPTVKVRNVSFFLYLFVFKLVKLIFHRVLACSRRRLRLASSDSVAAGAGRRREGRVAVEEEVLRDGSERRSRRSRTASLGVHSVPRHHRYVLFRSLVRLYFVSLSSYAANASVRTTLFTLILTSNSSCFCSHDLFTYSVICLISVGPDAVPVCGGHVAGGAAAAGGAWQLHAIA